MKSRRIIDLVGEYNILKHEWDIKYIIWSKTNSKADYRKMQDACIKFNDFKDKEMIQLPFQKKHSAKS